MKQAAPFYCSKGPNLDRPGPPHETFNLYLSFCTLFVHRKNLCAAYMCAKGVQRCPRPSAPKGSQTKGSFSTSRRTGHAASCIVHHWKARY